MNWRPHTQAPDGTEIFTALIAVRDEEDGEELFLLGIYVWYHGKWLSEKEGRKIKDGRHFWWLPESEVLEGLQGESS